MKKCGKCSCEKSSAEFHNRAASIDGLSSICKSCQSVYDKARANNPKRVKARLDYQKTDRGKKASAKAKKKWADNNTVKRAANIIIGNAIRDGVVTRGNCEICGEEKTHAHHDDYAKPLDVRWLCPTHHSQWHAENGEGANG